MVLGESVMGYTTNNGDCVGYRYGVYTTSVQNYDSGIYSTKRDSTLVNVIGASRWYNGIVLKYALFVIIGC